MRLSEKVNKLLFFKNKQLEQQVLRLQKVIEERLGKDECKLLNQTAEVSENEKLLLLQIEQQNKKMKELEDKLNNRFASDADSNSRVAFLQKRVDELLADSKRYFNSYQSLHNDYVSLMARSGGEKVNRNYLSKYQEMCRLQISEEQKLYEKRVGEVEKMAEEFAVKREKYEERVRDLEEKLRQKEEQETKIEAYVNKLLENYKEVKSDVIAILNVSKEGKGISGEYFSKYESS